MATIRSLNTTHYLKVLAPAPNKEIRKTDGTVVIAKKKSLKISWEHLIIFFCRLQLFLKTSSWVNTRKIKSILISELNTEITSLQTLSLRKANQLNPSRIQMVSEVFGQLKKRVKPDAAIKKIEDLLNHYALQERILKHADETANKESADKANPESKNAPPPPAPPPPLSPFPLRKNVALETLSPMLLNEYSRNILKQLAKAPKALDRSFFERADQFFDKSWENALSQVSSMHQAFHSKYDSNNLIQTSESDDVIVTSTLFQLKMAIDLIKKQFPHLTSLAYNLNQRIKVARLIQVILAGPSLLTKPLPQSDLCFQILELIGKQSPPKMIYLAPYKNFIDYQFATFHQRKQGQEVDDYFKSNLIASVEQFIKDCLKCTGNQIVINTNVFEVGKNIPGTNQSVFSIIKDLFGQYLRNNPLKAKELIKDEESLLFEKILEYYPCDAKELTLSKFPKSCFNQILAPYLKRYSSSSDPAEQHIHRQLLDLQTATDFDDALIQEIALNSGCTPAEIEPLMRKKMLQLMMMMNQSLHAIPTQKIAAALQTPGEDISNLLMPHAQSVKFEFSNHAFNSVSCQINFTITDPTGNKKVTKSLFTEKLPVAQIEALLTVSSLTSAALPKLTPFSKLKLGWLAPFSYSETLASNIDPHILSEQPKPKEELLRKKIEEVCNDLEILSDLLDQQEVIVNSHGGLSTINLRSGWFIQEVKLPNITNLIPLERYFKDFSALFIEYKKIYALLDLQDDTLQAMVIKKIPAVLKGLKVLHHTYKAASTDKGDLNQIIHIENHLKKLLPKRASSLPGAK